MIAGAALLLAMIIPGTDAAPIRCSEYRNVGAYRLGVERSLSRSGRLVAESVSWAPVEFLGPQAGATWLLLPRASRLPRLDVLAFQFYLPQPPARQLRARVEAGGREVLTLSVTPGVEHFRGQYVVIVRLIRPPFPGLPPDGPVPEIGAATQVSMTLEAMDGTRLGSVGLTLPDWQAVAPALEETRRATIEKARDFRTRCSDFRIPVPMPTPPPPG